MRKKTLLSEIKEIKDNWGLTREHIKLPYKREINNKIDKVSKIMREAKRKKEKLEKVLTILKSTKNSQQTKNRYLFLSQNLN